ncbi:MAG TPA: hypothetical protein VL172_06945, partial [Kofleriaceae bacterium]|nr:hypothetical protein [Kofleriaceae bacterium]
FSAATAADDADLDRAAVAAALANRGISAPAGAIADLAAFIGALRRRLIDEDEAWARLGTTPAVAFALAYVWTHLGIGAVDDERAAELIGACAPWFADPD